MRRVAFRAVLLIGLACAVALAAYCWQHGHSAPRAIHSSPTSVAARPNIARQAQFGPVTVNLQQPSDAPDVLSVRLRAGLRVRYVMDMPTMPGMGASASDAQPTGRDSYGGMVIFPMAGRTRIVVQVLSSGTWHPVQVLLYDVDAQRIAHPTQADAPTGRG
jgi:hypothetical protein